MFDVAEKIMKKTESSESNVIFKEQFLAEGLAQCIVHMHLAKRSSKTGCVITVKISFGNL